VVGAGGLGCPAALYLAGAGVGELTLVDFDVVELSNLHRQIAYTEANLGQPKVEALRQQLLARNPHVMIHAKSEKVDAAWLHEQLPKGVGLVLDCTDNFAVRTALNAACYQHKVPLISGAAIRYQGQVAAYDFTQGTQACAVCLFGEEEMPDTHCHEAGILGPVVGLIGTQQALLALQMLQGVRRENQLYILDAQRLSWRQLSFSKNPYCSICGESAPSSISR